MPKAEKLGTVSTLPSTTRGEFCALLRKSELALTSTPSTPLQRFSMLKAGGKRVSNKNQKPGGIDALLQRTLLKGGKDYSYFSFMVSGYLGGVRYWGQRQGSLTITLGD